MENTPAISFAFANIAPGADDNTVKRYEKWVTEVYVPMVVRKMAGNTGTDRYKILRKNPEYPMMGTIQHWEAAGLCDSAFKNPEYLAVGEELQAWEKRRVLQRVWAVAYELVYGFRVQESEQIGTRDTKIDNAPFLQLEAFRMDKEDRDKFNKWFSEYNRVFIPLFMKNNGLKGYDYFKFYEYQTLQAREKDYPDYISLLYFEGLEAFEHFEESPEKVSYQSALCNTFPLGLNYKWYVQYQLVQSWRK